MPPGAPGALIEQWRHIKERASDAVIEGGGTITHHHAVGRDHMPWYERQRPPLFGAALAAAKRTLDPAGHPQPRRARASRAPLTAPPAEGRPPPVTSYDAIVIGGGVVGASTAYHLVRAGVRTLLVDRRDVGRATDAGAGILSTAANVDDPDPIERFEARATAYYPVLVDHLREDDAGDTGYAHADR